MVKAARIWTFALVSIWLSTGCSPTADSSTGTVQTAGTSAHPTAGTVAAVGTVPAAGASGASAPASVPCGATTCTNPAAAFASMLSGVLPGAVVAMPCCVGGTTCGFIGKTGACAAPLPADPRCPAPNLPLPGAMATACCQTNGMCGIDGSALQLGCMSGFGASSSCSSAANGGTGAATAGSGASGTSGASGASGTSAGTSTGGTSAGTSAAGASGRAGASGTSAGTSAGGTGGSAGRAGTSGSSGTGGSAGLPGFPGFPGFPGH
jgi:hypothetical protein